MNERELFVAALEIDDPVARQVHLQSACGDDADLLRRVEMLLGSHEQQSRFLETPVVEQLEQPEPGTAATIISGAGSTQDESPDPLYKTKAGEDPMTHNLNNSAHEIPLGLLQPSTRADSLGRLGHYEILEILGRGAFGTVFRAFDDKLQRVVAIKVMALELAATSPARKRFLREAQASAAIRHENVVSVYGVEESPIPYLVMEYIPGQTLQQRLDQTGPLAIPDVLRLGRQIAEGLAAAHAQDLIHRDIKPGNILLEKGALERVKITDFGLARAADDASQTQSGIIAGTPMYMAPEQASGHKLDQRADLFSFGSVLYQMVSGRPPFRATTMLAVLKRVAEDSPRPIDEIIPETPAWLCAIVSKLHAKNPDERYQSAREIADVLGHCEAQVKTHGGIKDFSVIPGQRATPQRSSAWKWIVAALTLVVGLPLLALGLLVFNYLATTRSANPNVGMNSVPTTIIDGIPAGGAQTGWHGWPADAPKPAIAPFDATQAKQHQEEWAAYLKLPVEYTNTIGMKFVLIPPGEFTMGSSPQEIEAASIIAGADRRWKAHIHSEGPQRRVSVTTPFYLGVHEVTQSQFASVMKENPSLFSTIGLHAANDLGINTGDFPVEALTWHDAASFCRTLQENERLSPLPAYSLPTETQWEFACRAGTTTQFWPGDKDEDLLQIAWFNANGGSRPHAVAGFHANPFGLYDMHGNVWEWMADEWVPPANSPASIPTGQRVLRGGDWSAHPNSCRSSHRHADLPTARYGSVGFRAVLAVDAVRQALTSQRKSTPVTKTGRHGWPADAPKPGIAPFDATQAKQHQEEWAAYLKLPVEYTNTIGMKFVLIPPGEFTMGSTAAEIEEALKFVEEDEHWRECIKSEGPQHAVILTQPIYMGAHEVTQKEYEALMGKNPSSFAKKGTDSRTVSMVQNLDTANYPVEFVSWNDATEFCSKLSQKENLEPYYFRAFESVTVLGGTGYRLPTEAEWEFACRAGTTTKFWIGDKDEDLNQAGWFGTNSGGRTHAVGELKANPLGLFDIHGNVWEWVQDVWGPTYDRQLAKRPVVNPAGPTSGPMRVFRGGCWYRPSSGSRASDRRADVQSYCLMNVGFRASLSIDAVRQTLASKTNP